MNSLMVARAKRVVVIADSSKLGGHAFARICPIGKVETWSPTPAPRRRRSSSSGPPECR
jgi:DeoR/GlpR family transcriptional regulator of sugar metabolism